MRDSYQDLAEVEGMESVRLTESPSSPSELDVKVSKRQVEMDTDSE